MTATITDDVLAKLQNDADRAVLSSMKGSEVPEDILADMVSQETMSVLFPNTPVVKSDDTTNAQEGTTMTDNPTLTIAGFNLPPRTKGDRAYLGKEIPIGKASKALLVDLVAKLLEQQPQPQQQQSEPQLQILKRAYSDQLSANQKAWLRKQTKSSVQFREIEPGRYQVRFDNFTIKSEQVLAGILQKVCGTNNWHCKRQMSAGRVKHVYINMKLS